MCISTFSHYFNNNSPSHFCMLESCVQAADQGSWGYGAGVRTSCFSPADAAAGQEEGTSRGVHLPAHSFRSSPSVPRDDGVGRRHGSCPALPQRLQGLPLLLRKSRGQQVLPLGPFSSESDSEVGLVNNTFQSQYKWLSGSLFSLL